MCPIDFDPASYKVAQLRNVLLQNDVSYPSSAKKKDLIELFNVHVKPNAERKLKEIQSVVANDEGIVYIEKKSSKSKVISDDENEDIALKVEKSGTKNSKKSEDEKPGKSPRKSPRKTSKSSKVEEPKPEDEEEDRKVLESSPRKSRTSARNISGELGNIPDLKKSPPNVRERSPRRKASSKVKDDEEKQNVEVKKPRERSPRRKVSEGKETKSSTRERSPSKKAKEVEGEDVKPKKKESKRSSKVKVESNPPPKSAKEDDSDGELEQVTEDEFRKAKSPFKFGSKSKFESSFSNDNVFQSPGHSSPGAENKSKKIIPRKRTSETTSSAKSPKKPASSIRKTAFSSSPEPHQPVKSPAKKALEISKFEASSPPSNFLKNEIDHNDIFAVEESSKESYQFDNITEKTPVTVEKPKKQKQQEQHLQPDAAANANANANAFATHEKDTFETPNEGNASKISNFSSAASTPSKSAIKRKSLLPDFSKFKVSREFAKTLGITIQGEPEEEEEQSKEDKLAKSEDPELLGSDDEEEDKDDESNSEAEQSVNDDSVLRNLQEEIDDARSAVEQEAADAIKQVNDVFTEEKPKDKEQAKEASESTKSSSSFNFSGLFNFFKQLFVFFFFVFTVIFALWYREQRILIGYCGSEIDQPTFPNAQNEYLIRFDEFLQTLKPQCLDAPENAITLPKMKIKCRPDYAVYEPWYKIHGFFPFSDYCVKDEEKENIIKEVVSKSLELLRTKNANTKCGDGEDLEVGISDEELYTFFFESKSVSTR